MLGGVDRGHGAGLVVAARMRVPLAQSSIVTQRRHDADRDFPCLCFVAIPQPRFRVATAPERSRLAASPPAASFYLKSMHEFMESGQRQLRTTEVRSDP